MRKDFRAWLIAVAAVTVAAVVHLATDPFLPEHHPYVISLLAVVVAAWKGTTASSIFAAAAGYWTALFCAVWLGHERMSLTSVEQPEAIEYLLVSAAIVALAHGIRKGEQRSRTQADEVREALRKSQSRLRITFDRAAIGILEAEGDDRVVEANDVACQILGYSREQLCTMTAYDLTHPDDIAISRRMNADIHSGARDRVTYEKRYLRRDRSVIWVHVTVSAVRDEQNRWVRSVATIEDISERVHAAEALRASEARYRRLHDSIRDAFVIVSMDGRIREFNEVFTDMLGYEAHELQAMTLWDITPAKWHAVEAEIITQQVLRSGSSIVFEKEYLSKGGEVFPVELRAFVIRDELGNPSGMWAIVRDITARKRSEEALQRAMEDLREAGRKKDEYLAMLAHELRNPIAAIGAAASLLLQENLNPAKALFAKQALRHRVQQLSRLIEGLLDVSRIAQGKITLHKERLDLVHVIHTAVEASRTLIEEKKHTLRVQAAEGLFVHGDGVRLEQVVSNLLNNAAKYTDAGGHIELTAFPQDGQAVICVKDDGIGIPEGVIPRIFELFGQADDSCARGRGGLGIGLTIAKSLVEMHNGSISAFSRGLRHGSTFTVSIPLVPGAEIAGRLEEKVFVAPGLQILIVEDNPDTAIMTAALLESKGHHTEIAGDASAALESVSHNRPDVVLLDLGLPGMDGFQLARELRTHGLTDTPIVAVTGYGQERDFQRSAAAGMNYHLIKPVDYSALAPILAEVSPQAPEQRGA